MIGGYSLYELCAVLDPADTYLQGGFAASASQAQEITGMLILLPNYYPYAGQLKRAVERGRADAAARGGR